MIRKFLIFSLFALLFYTVSLQAGHMAPQSFKQALMAQATSAPSGDLDSEEFTFPLKPIIHEGILGSTINNWMREGVTYFIRRVITLLAGIIGGISMLVISIGGFYMIISAGDEDLYRKGADYVKYAVVGLVVALLAYVLTNAVQLLITSLYAPS